MVTKIASGYEIDGTTLSLALGNIIKLDLSNANTWTAVQTFNNSISIGGATFNIASLTSAQYIYYDGTDWVNVTPIVGATLTETSGQLALNLANANTWTATQTFDTATITNINPSSTQITLTGTTAGSIINSMPFTGTSYKKIILYVDAYENDTTTSQSITFPTAFATTNGVTFNDTTLSLVLSLSTVTVDTPDTTSTYSGMVIIEGY